MKPITRISIPVQCHVQQERGNDTYYGWLLDTDGPSAEISYSENQLKKNLKAKVVEALRAHQASERNYQQHLIVAGDGMVFLVQFRHDAWCYHTLHNGSSHASSCMGRKTFDECLADARSHAKDCGGIAWESSI